MSRIVIGKSGGRDLTLDLQTLLRTRLLAQANSGGGKSYLLRRMAEQLFGKVPVWIVDPEGEFASLREHFGFVLVGKGGETPADPRSAELVVRRLLEHRASVVFDLYELKPQARHHYVRLLVDALMNAPKELWTNLVFMLDEAHQFAPEKGQGESEAFGAVTDLATRGRKRGFCLAAFTQRLSKISKNVTAELLNRLVGMTFEDLDVESAANVLSVPRADREEFRHTIKRLEPGNFFGLGPAIAKDRALVKVGEVLTTHPEPGTAAAAAPPPAPEKIKALLPKLADLPKEAEEKAKTEVQLRAEIRSLKGQVAAAEKSKAQAPQVVQAPQPKVKPVEVRLLTEREINRLEKIVIEGITVGQKIHEAAKILDHHLNETRKTQAALLGAVRRQTLSTSDKPIRIDASVKPGDFETMSPRYSAAVPLKLASNERCEMPKQEGDVTPAQRRILQALADFAGIGRHEIPKTWVAARAKASHRSSAFANNLGALRSRGLIEYRGSGVAATVAGFNVCPVAGAPLTSEEMLASCLDLLTPAQQRILKAVADVYPHNLDRDSIAKVSNASPTSSAFANNLGALRSAGMIEYVPGAGVKCADWIFLEERSAR